MFSRLLPMGLVLTALLTAAPSVLPASAPLAPAAAEAKKGVLKKGSKGPRVRAVQRALHITADGVFGSATRRAVKRFQRKHGLTADGIVGPATLAALGLAQTAVTDHNATLQKIAQCESGGNPKAVSANGRYRGKYQFSRATWRALGGKGDPAKAAEATQDRLALKLLRRSGTSPWPSCA